MNKKSNTVEEVKHSSLPQNEEVETLNCFVDCRWGITPEDLPETGKHNIITQWEKYVCMGDFFNSDLFIGIAFWGDLPKLCLTHNPKEYNTTIPILATEYGAGGEYYFEPDKNFWYTQTEAEANYQTDLYKAEFVIAKLLTEIHCQIIITKK